MSFYVMHLFKCRNWSILSFVLGLCCTSRHVRYLKYSFNKSDYFSTSWKDPNNDFKKNLKLTGVPTLLHYGTVNINSLSELWYQNCCYFILILCNVVCVNDSFVLFCFFSLLLAPEAGGGRVFQIGPGAHDVHRRIMSHHGIFMHMWDYFQNLLI